MAERDFNLQMTGEQVKDALQQLEDRVAEGWAVGEKDGTPVTSGSPYYENNSKYWATQAENAATRAESAVPAGVDSAVLFTQEQQLTTDQQAQARQNIKAGGSNRNLLDNPWFTVNQKGLTGGNYPAQPAIDRWRTSYATAQTSTWTLTNGVLTLNAEDGNGYWLQRFEDYTIFSGKTFTASLLLADGTIISGTTTRTTGRNNFILNSNIQVYFATSGEFTIVVPTGKTISIKAVKLELGTVSTLANDTRPNYQQELAKCQRYFQRISSPAGGLVPFVAIGYANASTTIRFATNLLVTMRANPTVSGTLEMQAVGNGTIANVTALNFIRLFANSVSLQATISGTLTINTIYTIIARNGYIDLSAEL